MPAFEMHDPAAAQGVRRDARVDPLKAKLAEQIALLRAWDYRWARRFGADVARHLLGRGAVARGSAGTRGGRGGGVRRACAAGPRREQRLEALAAACDKLAADFGTWKTPWGEINRFQRIDDDIVRTSTTRARASRCGFTSARWGSLASFGARAYPGTKKCYGTSGNSFVAVVEFGDSVRARAVTAGGESGDPDVEALQRPGGALRHRQPARGVLLPERSSRATPSACTTRESDSATRRGNVRRQAHAATDRHRGRRRRSLFHRQAFRRRSHGQRQGRDAERRLSYEGIGGIRRDGVRDGHARRTRRSSSSSSTRPRCTAGTVSCRFRSCPNRAPAGWPG